LENQGKKVENIGKMVKREEPAASKTAGDYEKNYLTVISNAAMRYLMI
jgi:hypothetical protein